LVFAATTASPQTEAAARKHFKRMAEENFIGGWIKAY
jgi:hypothetical protein